MIDQDQTGAACVPPGTGQPSPRTMTCGICSVAGVGVGNSQVTLAQLIEREAIVAE